MDTVSILAHLRRNGTVDARDIIIEHALQAPLDRFTVVLIKKLHTAVEIITSILNVCR